MSDEKQPDFEPATFALVNALAHGIVVLTNNRQDYLLQALHDMAGRLFKQAHACRKADIDFNLSDIDDTVGEC